MTAFAAAALRKQFPALDTCIWLASSVQGPLPRATLDEMRRLLDDMGEHVCLHERDWLRRLQEIRGLAAQLIQCDPAEIAYLKNTNEGVNWIAEGLPFQAGDNVIGMRGEYPANVYPWLNQAARGVSYVMLEPDARGRVTTQQIIAACNDRTRVVALSSVEFASGFAHDLAALGKFCRSRGIFFFVDAIQSLGALPMRAKDWGVDALAADGRKWLLGPPAAGLFFLDARWREKIHTAAVGALSVNPTGEYTNYRFELRNDARRYEGGDPNWIGIHGLGKSLELLLGLGIENIRAQIFAMLDRLMQGLDRQQYGVFSSQEPGERSGILSLIPRRAEAARICEQLRAEHLICWAREQRVRIAVHAFITPEDIDALLGALRRHGG